MLLALSYAAYTDKKRGEIPIWLFPFLLAVFTLIRINEINWFDSLIGLFIGFVTFLAMALFFNGGGGDVIMMSAIGFICGVRPLLYISMLASGILLIFHLTHKDKKEVPYAPFVLLSYILFMIGGLIIEINNFWLLAIRYILL
ncbi:MAG: A24 family peptidase [Ruminococcus sp.]|nr:A24 family peptidase [Ruminococcus sp.]